MPVARNFRHGRRTRVLAQGYDMSCYLNDASISASLDTAEATAFCDSIRGYTTGLPDFTMSLGGLFESGDGSADTVLFENFGIEDSLDVVVCNEGFDQGRRARGVNGIITAYNTQNALSDVVSLSMEMQITGQLYVMTNVNAFDPDAPFSATKTDEEWDRTTSIRVKEQIAGTNYSSNIYVMGLNYDTSARTVDVGDHSASGGPFTSLYTLSIPAATNGVPGFAQGVSANITDVNEWINVNVASATGNVHVYVGLVDRDMSPGLT